MAFGKIYSYPENNRTTGLLVVAKENKLDIEVVDTRPSKGVSDDYRRINKLGKIPTFEGADGYVLSECGAIAVYLTSQNEKTPLLGKTKQDYASILRWLSFSNTEIIPHFGPWIQGLTGTIPYNKKNVETAEEKANKSMKTLEDHLLINTYLVGERISLADIMTASAIMPPMSAVFDKKWRSAHPSVTRWVETIVNQPMWKAVGVSTTFIDEAIKYTPPVKEKAPKQEAKKEAAKPKPKAKDDDEDEDDEPKEAPKPKHPIEALGKAGMPIDDWKRKYKNEETREVALPWFWENVNFDDYSIWAVDYKYNDELTMTFMTSNLIGGFFARLEASRKYIMGCASVYGVTNDSIVKGAFVVRGQDGMAAFEVAPDWESYDFKKLNPKDANDKKFVESMWAWDEPIEVDGKKYEWADGKIFASGGGPAEDNVTGFLVRSLATNWTKGSVLAVDAGSHLSSITRILEKDFPLVADPYVPVSRRKKSSITNGHVKDPSPQSFDSSDTSSRSTPEQQVRTLTSGPFAGLPFPFESARANALHVVRECVSTYLITHPHLDHLAAFAINTAAFHNTSRPKRLAALPSTVNAIKTHIFNDVIWPNLTDEDGGVGFVTFQRLTHGGNPAVGEGRGKGYIEVCDGLTVKGIKISHGHCTRALPITDGKRGSEVGLSEATVIKASNLPDISQVRTRRTPSIPQLPQNGQVSQPETPGLTHAGTQPAPPGDNSKHEVVVDSTAYFIRDDRSGREILMFGDVEPDSLSLNPRTALVWADTAPKITAGLLSAVVIECSYDDSQADNILLGHLNPKHLYKELSVLGEMVKQKTLEKQGRRALRKRKRTQALVSNTSMSRNDSPEYSGTGTGTDEESHSTLARKRGKRTSQISVAGPSLGRPPTSRASLSGAAGPPKEDSLSPRAKPESRPGPTPKIPDLIASQSENLAPLQGLTVIVMHVKDTLKDGPLVGDMILQQLYEHEENQKEHDGVGLGCKFVISKAGESYAF
ncbi:MAG: hypothetical protein M1828_001250 [Chrysothrix sp. TS-e1954]|nr:MAG: hypothetical protein M1828_001250 [Chrysothrix sp. TS-e1954]